MLVIFKNRSEAGILLSKKLSKFRGNKTIVLGIPRGGVVLGFEIAKRLRLPLNIIMVRKISHPLHPEFGLGAIAEGNISVFDTKTMKSFSISEKELEGVLKEEKKELSRRIKVYRKLKPYPKLKGMNVILVDDGLATGVTAKAAIKAIRKDGPSKIIFAIPLCSEDVSKDIEPLVDNFLCLNRAHELSAISLWYEEFYPVEDDEVMNLLKQSNPDGL